ncbi:MAG: hypothetical protein ACKOAZ_07370 [Ilumatobacteraceae bacterium]
MTRLCERPGCSAPASCSYGIDTSLLRVWIDALGAGAPPGAAPRAGALCRRHADAMVVPRGWQVDDRRAALAQPVAARGEAAPPPSAPRADTATSASAAPAPGDAAPAATGGVRRRLRRARQAEGPQPEQLVLLDLDAGAGADADAEPAAPGDGGDAPRHDIGEEVPDAPGAGPEVDVEPALVQSTADTHVDDAPGESPAAAVDATPIAPWRPVFDHADDLGGVLQARSPLLARAFGRRGRAPAPAPRQDGRSAELEGDAGD